MDLVEALRADCVETGVAAKDKQEVLHRIAQIARRSAALGGVDEQALLQALRAREELGTTGFGEGIAIPHCRMAEVPEFVVGLVTAPEGVPFDALDGEPVKLLVFIVAPDRESSEHIRLLSAISQVLRIKGAVDELLSAQNAEAAREGFLRFVRDEVETRDHAGKNLVHLFIQNEDNFRQVLQVFAAMGTCYTLVVEGERTGTYLARVPLFAGFWSDADRGFNRIIVAAVDKKLTNETIRRIEEVTGPLDECNDALLLVQDVFYASGRLKA